MSRTIYIDKFNYRSLFFIFLFFSEKRNLAALTTVDQLRKKKPALLLFRVYQHSSICVCVCVCVCVLERERERERERELMRM